MERVRNSTSRRRERRATYRGSAGRQFGGGGGQPSPLDYDRFIPYILRFSPPPSAASDDTLSDPAIQPNPSPPDSSENAGDVASDAHPTNVDDVLSPPFVSLLRDLHSEEDERGQEDEQERDQEAEQERGQEDDREETEEATTPPVAVSQPENPLDSTFRALQLPSEIPQADFIHLADQFVFENSSLQRFRDANEFNYDEAALAMSFSSFSMDIWGDDAPEGDNANQWLAHLTHFFAILRTGPYMRGGTTATPRELLIRLIGTETDFVEARLIDAHRDLYLTEVEEGRLEDFADLAAAHALDTYAALDNESADLQGLGDLYDVRYLAEMFLTFFRIAFWDGTDDETNVRNVRVAALERFFLALGARNYKRKSASTPREGLVRLVGLQIAKAVGFEQDFSSDANPPRERRGSTGDAAGPIDAPGYNSILSDLFTRLTVHVQHRDRYLRDGFQHAVTHIAFEIINATRERPLTTFGPHHSSQDLPNIITPITNGVVARYAVRLWPQVVGMSPPPGWLTTALREYISALIEIPAEKAQNGETALRVLDNILGLNQEELQAGLASADNDGLECALREMAAFDACSTPFAAGADLWRHMTEDHGFSEEDARDAMREAEIALRTRAARRH
jgi:hypothetical protein